MIDFGPLGVAGDYPQAKVLNTAVVTTDTAVHIHVRTFLPKEEIHQRRHLDLSNYEHNGTVNYGKLQQVSYKSKYCAFATVQ